MGLFSNSYSRPGPGVRKDEPKKKPIPRFFELLFRKFTELVKLNLIFMIPFIIVIILSFAFLMAVNNTLFAIVPAVLLWPFFAGLAFVTRNYVREEHAFVFSDFVDAVKQNCIPFLINGMICLLVYLLMSIAIPYYYKQTSYNMIFYVPLVVCLGTSFIFLFAQYYIPVMLVTFDMKLQQIYKNGFIFSIIGLWRNLLLLVIMGLEIFLLVFLMSYVVLTVIIGILWIIFFIFSFNMFLINFIVYPLIEKYMIKPQNQDEEKEADASDFSDTL